MRRLCAVFGGLLVVLAALAPSAQGQQSPPLAAPPLPTDTSAPPYERQLLRLAEILGALSFLRDICGDNDSAEWRRRMTAIIEAEGVTGARRGAIGWCL